MKVFNKKLPFLLAVIGSEAEGLIIFRSPRASYIIPSHFLITRDLYPDSDDKCVLSEIPKSG